ncbi:MAG TPA: class I tRNA ligase family protein, partial [Verrucomicrobiae bacterium]|nr:class I tRNA ligase family protein [Verrucomicrobiae bacterium]
QNNVGFSERADVPVEPRLSEQWFLRYPSVAKAVAAPQNGDLVFFPERWRKVYDHWMRNIQDWCISRQLWWGHRIPVWYRGAETRCQAESPGPDWAQDADVLDTWFSSWLWPFETMDEATRRKFYPTSVLVSGPDILFFWVARMVMAGLEFTGQTPFAHVYLTGIVRDKLGRKMSKSLGNSPDPLDLIAKYSADALRFGVMRSAPLGQDVLFDEQHVELGRNFCTKLWNACRFRQIQAGEVQGEIDSLKLTSDDKWIFLRLDSAISEITSSLAEYKFNEATSAIYRFFWSEFCDWYLESTKAVFFGNDPAQKQNTIAVLDFILSHTLRFMHPFLPFVTEELWHGLGYHIDMPADQGGESILFAPWPKPLGAELKEAYSLDSSDDQYVTAKYDLITKARNLRREFNISAARKVLFIIRPVGSLSTYEQNVLRVLLNAEAVEIARTGHEIKKGTPSVQSSLGELLLPLEGVIDVEAERKRLHKEIEKFDGEIRKVQDKLNNPGFTSKVPAAVLDDHQKRLAEWSAKKEAVLAQIRQLGE